jgi:class 3 adenylate cyclase
MLTGDKDPKPIGKQGVGLVDSGRKLSSNTDKEQDGLILLDNALPDKDDFPGVDPFPEPVSKPVNGPVHPDMSIKRQIAESLFGPKKSCAAPLCVLAVHLKDLDNLSNNMLPEDYFVFVNDIFRSLEICGQTYGAVNGEVGQDMLCFYFFKNPKTEYVRNALRCAAQMQKEMAMIRRRMGNLTGNAEDVLCLNIGIAEGTEFVGLIHFDQGLTFKALGATPDHAKKLCGFGRGGEIWITQFGMGKLPAKDVKTLSFGVHRMDADGRIHHMPNMFAKVKDIFREGIAPSLWEDISHLPVTRVSEIFN